MQPQDTSSDQDHSGDDGYVIVPAEKLSAEVLTALIEEFILHEGANHGAESTPMALKIAQVRKQLDARQAYIVYHLEEESCRILPAHAFTKR